MKKTTFTFLLLLSCCHWPAAQCPTGDVTFYTQEQVDSFLLNYPNCDSIRGSLRIGSSTDIADLSALAGIRFVKNSITITDNRALTTLSGLDSIYSFGRFPLVNYKPDSLVIRNNDLLLNLKGLGNPSTKMANPLMYVVVADNNALTTLEGFEFLQRAGDAVDFGFGGQFPFGGLRIRNNINLANLNGLNGLSGGIVEIQDNDNLQSLEGFGHSFGDSATAYLVITENDKLPNLWGLDSLSRINSLHIGKNGNLQNLTGLQNLANVNGGYLYEDEGGVALTWGLEISQNNTLQNLNGLDNLKTVTGYLYINENEQLANLDGLDSLRYLYAGYLGIDGNPALLNIDALGNLESIGQFTAFGWVWGANASIGGNKLLSTLNGLHQIDSLQTLYIGNNNVLISLNGLEDLQSVGTLDVYENENLGTLNGMKKLQSAENVRVAYNPSLTTLNGLENLQFVNYLAVNSNQSLTALTGLENLQSVDSTLDISNNDMLADLTGLGDLQSLGGDLVIANNDALTSFSGLENLQSPGGALIIRENAVLPSLAGLNHFNSVGKDLVISGNNALKSLNGLENVKRLGTAAGFKFDLAIYDNPELESISGLDSLNFATIGALSLYLNPKLSACNIRPVCIYLKTPAPASVYGNAAGCKSKAEIQMACLASPAEELPVEDIAIRVYPNPVKEALQIQVNESSPWEISISDLRGRLLYREMILSSRTIEVGNWPAGLYMLRATAGERVYVERFVKQ